jgi:nucleoside-diphosphate-sugar epimerase
MCAHRILVTGGAGFIGTNLVHELRSRGHEVLAVDLLNNERDNYIRADVRNYHQIERIFDMANTVNILAGNKADILYKEHRDWDVKTRLLSCIMKAEKVLGYKPKMKFETGLKATHEEFVENWEAIEKRAEF